MSLIPKRLYQSWKTKNLDSKMAEIVEKNRRLNPDYVYELYDDNDCRQFLLDHFGQNYANAFDILIPGAFKCDFWRYAKLYVDGGIYMDIDMTALVPFSQFISPTDEFVSVVDMMQPYSIFMEIPGIYQAFLACRPKHPIILLSLQLSFYNIVSRRAGIAETLSITGPGAVGIAWNLFWEKKNTFSPIKSGIYPNGIKLFTMDNSFTYDLNKTKIISNKYEDYNRGLGNYGKVESFYKDDPRLTFRRIIAYGIIILVLIAFIGLLFTFVYRKRWRRCQTSCKPVSNSSQ